MGDQLTTPKSCERGEAGSALHGRGSRYTPLIQRHWHLAKGLVLRDLAKGQASLAARPSGKRVSLLRFRSHAVPGRRVPACLPALPRACLPPRACLVAAVLEALEGSGPVGRQRHVHRQLHQAGGAEEGLTLEGPGLTLTPTCASALTCCSLSLMRAHTHTHTVGSRRL